ncbi:EAL domain-containing protein [Pseudomonas sp. UBA7530]|uniref:EAL domain-containing protein n=1 Tax=Pseudomonas sp. UBA7530 TaxID=1947341 RepID=UPI000EE406B5|nr:EAL domain-containing protein [Pseudomonas sp. UBA7530]HBZ92605.1 diguanylate cyclase [Pseudomonas sp.]
MLRPLRALILLLCLAGAVRAWAGSGLPLMKLSADDLARPVSIEHSLLLEDPSRQLSASEVLQRIEAEGRQVRGTARIGYTRSAWWLAVQLQAPASERLQLIIGQAFLDDLEVWLFDGEQSLGPLYSGAQRAFAERGEPYPQFLLNLPRLGDGPHSLLLRVQSDSAINLPLQLVGAEHGQQLIAHSWLRSGLLIGVLIALALFYLVKYSTLREAQLAYFSLTSLCVALYNTSLYNLAGLLWPQWPLLPKLLINLPTAGMMIFSSLFIASALGLQLGRLRWLRDALFAGTLLVSVGGLLVEHPYTYQTLNLLILASGLYQLLLMGLGIAQRRPYAPGYLLCWSAALVLMLLVPLGRAGLIALPAGFYALYAYLPALSMLLFGALLDKQLERVRRVLLSSQAQAIDNLEQYQALFRHSGEGIFRCQRDGRLLEVNPSLARLLGSEAVPDDLGNLSLQRLVGETQWQSLLYQLDEQAGAVSCECELYDLAQRPRWVYLSLHLRAQRDCIEGIVVDLSERRVLEERLQRLAAHDALTGLLNRRELERLLAETLGSTAKRRFSHLLLLGLDRFKQVNDLFGHSAGDQLLRQLAGQLQHQLPRHAELARVGGDEFAVLLREVDDDAALDQAEQLRRAVEQFVFTWQGRPFRLHVSIGMLALGSGVRDWETALNWASSASQLAKHQGRNRVQQFNPDDGALLEHQRQLQWITRLREATERGHFELFFQPVQALQSAATELHYEVLLRYRDPHSGEWISPAQFLDAAARYDFLGAIDRWVIQHLCAWLATNPRHLAQLAQVNVNLSASSLLDRDFHQLLEQELAHHGLPPGKLCIEVTEMVALGELGVSAQWIEKLRGKGLKVALDDFGSGFASYAYLRHLPLDILKIDGSFISGIEHDPINQAMVGSMRQIAAQLGLVTVAEFVETQASLDCLRRLGIDYAQGYFVGRPQPLRQLADEALHHGTQQA